jgi:hypothetical protein
MSTRPTSISALSHALTSFGRTLRASIGFSNRHYPLICRHGPIRICAVMVEETLCPARQSSPVVRVTASETSDQRSHLRGRDGQCGSPPLPLLVCAGSRLDRSDDRATLDGPKLSLATGACLGRLLPRVDRTDWSDAPTGVSAHRRSREYPCNGGRAHHFDAEISGYLPN